jgi:hypothetical protein
MRYESLHLSYADEISRCLEFCGISGIDRQMIQRCQDETSFKKMQATESSNQLSIGPMVTSDPTDKRTYKVRERKIGSYTNYLSDEDLKYIDRCIDEFDVEEFVSA